METNEKLSISIPTKNRCFQLQGLLESIKKQITNQPALADVIKIYIFDNDSSDATAELVCNFDIPLIYQKSEHEISLVDNIIQGYETPTGQYIWLVGDDELLADGAIESILALLEKFEPSLLLNKVGDYQSLVQMPLCFGSYQDYALFAQHYNPHLLLEHTSMSANVVRRDCFDIEYAREHKLESYVHMLGTINGVKKTGGKVAYNQYETIKASKVRGNSNSSVEAGKKITYLTWLKKEYALHEIVSQRVVADYNHKLHPAAPKVSILLNFETATEKTVDENLKILQGTIESILVQDYFNIEIIVNSNCNFWSEYIKFAHRTQPYGKTVKYVEFPLDVSEEVVREFLNGEYLMLMNVGEYLTDNSYITSALKIMISNVDIGISFANYSWQDELNIMQAEHGLSNTDTFSVEGCTKMNGQWLFFNYDKLWCRPCTTIFRQELLADDMGKYLKNINKLMFPWLLLETNIAFHNKVVAKCPSDFEDGSGKITLESYYATLEYIDFAVMNALMCNCPKAEVQQWRENITKKYCLAIIKKAGNDIELLIGLHGMAKKTGVAHLLHEAMSEIVSKFSELSQVNQLKPNTENMLVEDSVGDDDSTSNVVYAPTCKNESIQLDEINEINEIDEINEINEIDEISEINEIDEIDISDSVQPVQELHHKYSELQSAMQKRVDDFYWEKMHNEKIIAVHMCAGDENVNKEIAEENNQLYYAKIAEFSQREPNCMILLLTDTEAIVQKFEMICGERLIYTAHHRRVNDSNEVDNNAEQALLAEELVIDVCLAAKCDYFIGCQSEISNAILGLKEWNEENVHIFEPVNEEHAYL